MSGTGLRLLYRIVVLEGGTPRGQAKDDDHVDDPHDLTAPCEAEEWDGNEEAELKTASTGPVA